MKLKIVTLIFCGVIGFIGTGYGQQDHHGKRKGGGSVEDRINRHLNKMDEIVKFTGTQKTDMKNLFDAIARQKKDAFCANEPGSDGMKNAMKTIRREKEDGLKKILTNDQLTLWKNHQKENRSKHDDDEKHHGKGDKKGKGTVEDRINHRLDKMDETVKFTGNQRDQMKALMNEVYKRKRDAVCSNEMNSDGMKNAMKAIHEYKKEEIKKILSEDQMKLLKNKRKEFKSDSDKLKRIGPDELDPGTK